MWTDTQPAGARVTVFPVWPPQARILGSFPFILWREEWMTQVADEKTPGSPRWWSPDRWKRSRTTAICSPVCRKRKWWWGLGSGGGGGGGGGGGSSQGSRMTLYQQPTCSDTRRPKPTAHFFQLHLGLGVTFLFVAMATQDSLSFPSSSHMSRCGQTHTREVCSAIEADSPLVDGCFFLMLWAACEQ